MVQIWLLGAFPSYLLCYSDMTPPFFERFLREHLLLCLDSAISTKNLGSFQWRMAYKRMRLGLLVCCYCVVAFRPSQQIKPGNYICSIINIIMHLINIKFIYNRYTGFGKSRSMNNCKTSLALPYTCMYMYLPLPI